MIILTVWKYGWQCIARPVCIKLYCATNLHYYAVSRLSKVFLSFVTNMKTVFDSDLLDKFSHAVLLVVVRILKGKLNTWEWQLLHNATFYSLTKHRQIFYLLTKNTLFTCEKHLINSILQSIACYFYLLMNILFTYEKHLINSILQSIACYLMD